MKHTIRLLCIGMALLCCVSGCNKKTDAEQTTLSEQVEPITLTADSFSPMHLSVSDSGLLGENAVFWTSNVEAYKEFHDSESDKSIKLNGKSVTLNYRNSWWDNNGWQYDAYQSEDDLIEARYSNSTGKLTWLWAEQNCFNIDSNWTTEKEYLNWIKGVLAEYGVKDLSGYDYSCRSITREWGDDWAGHGHYDYFYTIKDPSCESAYHYYFTFSKTIGGFSVSDKIEVCVRFGIDGGITTTISFDEGRFDNVIEIKMDRTKMEKTLDEYVRGCINTEKYNLHSYEITNQVLTYKDGKLCNVYTVEVNFTPLSAPNSEPFSSLETIGVFCE